MEILTSSSSLLCWQLQLLIYQIWDDGTQHPPPANIRMRFAQINFSICLFYISISVHWNHPKPIVNQANNGKTEKNDNIFDTIEIIINSLVDDPSSEHQVESEEDCVSQHFLHINDEWSTDDWSELTVEMTILTNNRFLSQHDLYLALLFIIFTFYPVIGSAFRSYWKTNATCLIQYVVDESSI